MLLLMYMFLKILSGMANYVDSDQSTPSGESDLGLHCFAHGTLSDTLVFEISGHLP